MKPVDVLVIGGGPVGLAAAIDARLHGLSVSVVESRQGLIDKACGEGLMPGALPMLARLGVEPVGQPLLGVTYSSGNKSVTHKFTHGPGRGVRRTALIEALQIRATELGTDFIHATLKDMQQSVDLVTVTLSDGRQLTSNWLLGADGLHSNVARATGLSRQLAAGQKETGQHTTSQRPSAKGRRYGLRRHYSTAPWSPYIEVFYAGNCEIYVTPVSADQVGVAMLGPRKTDFDEAIASVPELAVRLHGAEHASELAGAGSFPQQTVARRAGRVLLIGDASGYVDPITGEGLRLGFAHARAAIECIVAGEPEQYEKIWRSVSRDFRVLTTGLVSAATSPIRGLIVPLAVIFPKLFGYVVDRLAR